MGLELRKATRTKLKGRIGLSGASGSGKTYSALRLAYGLCGDWEKIAIIDTEHGRGELYVNTDRNGVKIGEYNCITLEPPFMPQKYVEAIGICENAGIEVIIVDSLSHAWDGTGGMLDIKNKHAAGDKENDFTAWRHVTPLHNQLVDKILRTDRHMLICCRAKTEYVLERDERGRTTPKKIGMKPIFRDGLEYEMTVFLDLSAEHIASASKDNSGLFDLVPFQPSEEDGQKLRSWLESGAEPTTPKPTQQAAPAETAASDAVKRTKVVDAIRKDWKARAEIDPNFGTANRRKNSIMGCMEARWPAGDVSGMLPADAVDYWLANASLADLREYGRHNSTRLEEDEQAEKKEAAK